MLHLSRKIIFANLKNRCSKMQPLSGNQHPDLLTSLMNMSLVLHLPRNMHLCRSSSNVQRLPMLLNLLQNPHILLTFLARCRIPCACQANDIRTSKSRNVRHTLFRQLNSKSARKLRRFVHFDFEMWFTPQRRALFRHLNFQKWSEHEVCCTF